MEKTSILSRSKWWLIGLSFLISYLSYSPARAQGDVVSIQVRPTQRVLPPQIGRYITDPGRFFNITLINNSDDEQLLHMGVQVEQTMPERLTWVSTNHRNNHIPREPLVLAPRQHKTLNSIEAKNLFRHLTSDDYYIYDGATANPGDATFGLLNEGDYELLLTAYQWNPELTSPIPISDTRSGSTTFTVCYNAQAPVFTEPLHDIVVEGLTDLNVVKMDKTTPVKFTWTAPTLNCNPTLQSYYYDLRIVKLESMTPDEAMEPTTITFYERRQLSVNTFTLEPAYVRQMIGDKEAEGPIFALQVKAYPKNQTPESLNYTLIENEGKSPILLFRLKDPNYKEEKKEKGEEGEDGEEEKQDSILYVFEQPTLTHPTFAGMTGRKIYFGEDIKAEWRKAWFASGRGEQQDTVKFEYDVNLYVGNSADKKENIFKQKPIFTTKTENLKQTIEWKDIKDKVKTGDYFMLRVTAKSTNTSDSIYKMQGDSLNYKDFALASRFNDNYQCGNEGVFIKNKTLVKEKPDKNKTLKIGEFYMTFNDDVEMKEDSTFSGTGWVRWNPTSDNFLNMNARVAVKFEKLKVNTEYEVFDGVCRTYAKSTTVKEGEYSAEMVVDSIFSPSGLDNIFGDLSIPDSVRQAITTGLDGETQRTLAQSYHLGKYFKQFATSDNSFWDDLKHGDMMDLYFPVELPQTIKNFLPKDFSIQIANMQFTPQSAQMNLIAQVALPNIDIFDGQDMLVFGAPRLCIKPDKFFPDEGVLALLSNINIKDPASDFKMVFKAPSEPLSPEPYDGCFLRWADGDFGGLGLEIAMTIPNTNRVVDGKAQKDVPALLDMRATIRGNESAGDFIAVGTMTPFEVRDLPGWTFSTGETIIYDHNLDENDRLMPTLADVTKEYGDAYDPSLCGTYAGKNWDTAWQGAFIKNVSVGFPKFSVLGGEDDKGLTVGAEDMIIDGSGVTCHVYFKDILHAETNKAGGWKFTIDEANVNFVQNNFDNCYFKGGIGIPLFHKKEAEEDKKDTAAAASGGDKDGGKTATTGTASSGDKLASGDKDKKEEHQDTDFAYYCEIRHLTDPSKEEKYYTWDAKHDKNGDYERDGKGNVVYEKVEHTRKSYGDKSRYAYIFTVEEVDDLSFSCFVADVTLKKEQTYFVVEAEDTEDTTDTDTRVELCLGGDLDIGALDDASDYIKGLCSDLPLDLKLPDIHFAKMRLSNKKRDEWHSTYTAVKKLQEGRDEYDKEWTASHKMAVTLLKSTEMKVTDECYFDLGEWSLASERKKLGPFSFNLSEFKPSVKGDSLLLAIEGDIGLIEDKICVGAGVTISSKIEMNDITDIKLSDGDVSFKSVKLDIDWTEFHFLGELKTSDTGDKGYQGKLELTVNELFSVKCAGGYFEHKGMTDEEKAERYEAAMQKAEEEKREFNPLTDVEIDDSYSWGYFKLSMESEVGIRVDPVVINRIAGGFYFNCKPTKGSDDDKFGGDPVRQYGIIGLAAGLTMSTSAGEDAVNIKADLLVAYDRKNNCLSQFLFNGEVEAVGGILKGQISIVYENDGDKGVIKNRYLCMNLTMEIGPDISGLVEKAAGINDKLQSIKASLDKFQENVDKFDVTNIDQSLKNLNGDYLPKDPENPTNPEDINLTAGKTTIKAEFKVTWVENSIPKPTPKWHLYVGEPATDKRCSFIYLKYGKEGDICYADIGADGYVCVGNELPNNGALPAIDPKIRQFLTASTEGVDANADLGKVERSRAAAVKDLIDPTSLKGGVIGGASVKGNIGIDLGLIYGKVNSLAGFDASIINYGANAICVNSNARMGWNGWYLMGQLYAYLDADLGIHIKLGHLIDRKVPLLKGGLGGLIEMGLPNPTWIEGQLRVNMSFLDGLWKVNKAFTFSAGDHCVPFRGNALDGFELFQSVSLGSDSLYQALYKPEFAVSANEVRQMYFATNTSIGSHYRLVDPSYLPEVTKNADTEQPDSLFNIYASRTYVFNMNEETRNKMGVRLFDLGTKPTELVHGDKELDAKAFNRELMKHADGKTYDGYQNFDILNYSQVKSQVAQMHTLHESLAGFFAAYCSSREKSCAETSYVMYGNDIQKNIEVKKMLFASNVTSYIDDILNGQNFKAKEVNVNVRETKGNVFHLTGMDIQPGHSYALVLMGDAFEIQQGRRRWIDFFTEKDGYNPIKWRQSKVWFFRVKTNEEDQVIGDSLRSLEPYIALAYPSVNGTKVKSSSEGNTTAYIADILNPTIALNRDLRTELPATKMKWRLTAGTTEQVQPAKYVATGGGKCINLCPSAPFNRSTDMEQCNLRLEYTYRHITEGAEPKDSTVALVDLWLEAAPHDVTVNGTKIDDSWLVTTSKDVGSAVLPYSRPYVGARPTAEPVIDYTGAYISGGREKLTDTDIVFDNVRYSGGTPMRLLDPYVYLATLGKWTFIGDRKIRAYAWDKAFLPFASETMVFQRGGNVVNSEFLSNQENKSVYGISRDMYATWNDWHYNNSNLPEYPLPTTAETVGGPTANNQDGRASTVTPLNVNHYSDQTYNLMDMAENFAAAYYVADEMSDRLNAYATDIYRRFATTMNTFNYQRLDEKMREFNDLHRGQYIEVEHRGTVARVPFYQLPFIFGDCLGDHAKFYGFELDNTNRSFKYTIGSESNMTSKIRWKSDASNLLFFRLVGTSADGVPPDMQPETFLRYTDRYADSYLWPVGHTNQMKVERDDFDARASLAHVKEFKARLYRVDSYDISTGLFTVNRVGGGPWTEDIVIDAANATAKNMGEMLAKSEEARHNLETHFDYPQPQALMAEDGVLTILYSDSIYQAGQTINGHRITNMSHGDDFLSEAMSHSKGFREATTVTVDPSFADYEPRSTAFWFDTFKNVKRFNGLEHINTSKVTSMHAMFLGCSAVESLDLSHFDTKNVTDMESMFAGCKKLKTLTHDFNTNKVKTMNYMFLGCSAMTALDIDAINAYEVENTVSMLEGCSSLKTLRFSKFRPQNIKKCNNMFRNVTAPIAIWYAYGLTERIKEQFPTGYTGHMANCPIKAMHIETDEGEQVLLFVNNANNFQKGKTYDIEGRGTTYHAKVKNVWTERQVTHADGHPGWLSVKDKVTRVIIDASFTDSPATTAHWFDSFEKLIAIDGLDHLYTEDVTDMSYMFRNCKNLKSLDLSNMGWALNVTSTAYMFYGCEKLQTLDVSQLPTGAVTTMERMFAGCKSLWKLTVKGTGHNQLFDTGNVTNMENMFYNCERLQSLDLGEFSTWQVTRMNYMFAYCKSLTELKWDSQWFVTDRVEYAESMFYGCERLKKVDMSNCKMPKMKSLANMFMNCYNMNTILLDNMTRESNPSYNNMFTRVPTSCFIQMPYETYHGSTLESNYLKQDTYTNLSLIQPAKVLRVKDGTGYRLVFLSSLDSYLTGSKWKGMTVDYCSNGLEAMDKLDHISQIHTVEFDPSFAAVKPRTTKNWFAYFSALKTIVGLEYLNTANVTDMSGMFAYCKSLTTLDLSTFNTASVKNMTEMFSGCSSLESLDVSRFNTANVFSMNNMFSGCKKLGELNLSNFNTGKVAYMVGMFNDCTSLTSLDLSSFDTRQVEYVCSMEARYRDGMTIEAAGGWLNDCTNLKELKLGSGFLLSNLQYQPAYSPMAFKGIKDITVIVPLANFNDIRTAFIDKLGFKEGDTGTIVQEGQAQEEAGKVPQVIWTESNATLTFYYGPLRAKGGTFEGVKVTDVWNGDQVTAVHADQKQYWHDNKMKTKVQNVVFDPSFAQVRPTATKYWFCELQNLATIKGMEYLNTSEVTQTNSMFSTCLKLQEIDMSHFNTDKVESTVGMFYRCSALKLLRVSNSFSLNKISKKQQNVFVYVKNLDVRVTNSSDVGAIRLVFTDKLGFELGTTGTIQ